MAKLKKILIEIISVLLVSTLISCSINQNSVPKDAIQGIIVPHHLLVEIYIDQLYKLAGESRSDIDRVIVISPNHFDLGFAYIQSTDQTFSKKNLPSLDTDFIKDLDKKTPLKIEPKFFEKEHGIMNELPFISHYFPNAKVVPISIKRGTPEDRLDTVIKEISKNDLSHTFIIASIDFTHYVSEDIALANDHRTIAWLTGWQTSNPIDEANEFTTITNLARSVGKVTQNSIAMDSPGTLYTFLKLMEFKSAKHFTLFKRTSSASLLNIKDPLQNTSHIFGIFR